MIQIKSREQFNGAISSFGEKINNLTDLFDNENTIIEEMLQDEVWYGLSADAFERKYGELKNHYSTINTSLNSFKNFMSRTLSNYSENDSSVTANADKYGSTLGVSNTEPPTEVR